MNVILDYVANHVHEDHPIYKKHPDWATDLYLPDGSMNIERWDDHRLTTWFDTFLPTLDLSRPEVYSAMTDSAMWWVENSAVDGFRHDATKHIPEVFWRTLTMKMKVLNRTRGRRLFQIGETYGSPTLISSYISSGMLDAQFDFNHYDAAVAALAFDDGSFENLASTARESLKSYGAHNLMGNITGNQDRIRFTSLADGGVVPEGNGKFEGWTQDIKHVKGGGGFEKMRMLMSYLMAMPGIPCIYYGDEIADVGGNDPDNRRVMRFDDLSIEEGSTLSWTSEWIQLRRSRMSLLYGSCNIEALSQTLLKITREYLGEESVVYINKSKESVEVSAEGKSILAGKAEDLQSGMIVIPSQSAICLGD
jgi:cyclomaltodextrinase